MLTKLSTAATLDDCKAFIKMLYDTAKLKGYGNAINAEVARIFIESYMESTTLTQERSA